MTSIRTQKRLMRILAVVLTAGHSRAEASAHHEPEAGRGSRASTHHEDHHEAHQEEGRGNRPGGDTEHGAEHGEDGHHEGSLPFGAEQLAKHGITVAEAAPGRLDSGIELLGEVHPDGDHLAHVVPRFAGVAKHVRHKAGDRVRAGEVLAVVESSESLASYPLTTSIDGVVLAKHITPGEAVGTDQEAFVVADLSSVWINLRVYQKDLARVSTGQEVRIRAGHGHAGDTGTISYVSPTLDAASRTAIARVVLENPLGTWKPGMFVSASVIDPTPVGVALPATAVQSVESLPSVFVVTDARVEARPVTLGRRGRTLVEIVSGLAPGERVAVENTFLLKAELGKSEAEHEH